MSADQTQNRADAAKAQAQAQAADTGQPLLEVKNLKKYFPIRGGVFSRVVANVKAVEDVSFAVSRARSSASWASRARARPRPAGRSCA